MNPVNSSEQLRELSSIDLNFLENNPIEVEPSPGEDQDGDSNSTVRDLENILDKFEADTQLLLDNPNQLLNCKYPIDPSWVQVHLTDLLLFRTRVLRYALSLSLSLAFHLRACF